MPYRERLAERALLAGGRYDEAAEDSVLRLMLSDLAVRRHEPTGAPK
jgi:hypothetical protein